MKNNVIRILALVCMGLFFIAITGCNNAKSSKPMLKITTSTQVGFCFSNTKYYIVYENGAAKKTDKFTPTDVVCYSFRPREYDENSIILNGLDVNSPEGEELKKIGNNILNLTEQPKLKIVAVSTLYVLDERYFFDVLYDKDKRISKLFEYTYADNSIKEVASFDKGSITHVELYELK